MGRAAQERSEGIVGGTGCGHEISRLGVGQGSGRTAGGIRPAGSRLAGSGTTADRRDAHGAGSAPGTDVGQACRCTEGPVPSCPPGAPGGPGGARAVRCRRAKRLNRCAVDARSGNRVNRFDGSIVACPIAAVHGRRARPAGQAERRGAGAAGRICPKPEACGAGRRGRSKDDRRRQTHGGEESKMGGQAGRARGADGSLPGGQSAGLRAEYPRPEAAAEDRLAPWRRNHCRAVHGFHNSTKESNFVELTNNPNR